MKTLKKTKLSTLTLLSLLSLTLAACGGGGDSSDTDDSNSNDDHNPVSSMSISSDNLAVLGDSTTVSVSMATPNNLKVAQLADSTKVTLTFNNSSDAAKINVSASPTCDNLTTSNSCVFTITPNSDASLLTNQAIGYNINVVDNKGDQKSYARTLTIKSLDISAPTLSKTNTNTYTLTISNNSSKSVDLSDGISYDGSSSKVLSMINNCPEILTDGESCELSVNINPGDDNNFIFKLKNSAGHDFLSIPLQFSDQHVKVYWPNWATYDNAAVSTDDPNYNPYDQGYQPEDIPTDRVDEIVYAFAQVGNCAPPFASDSQPDLCNANSGAYATGVQDHKLYSSDPYSDFATIPSTGYNNGGTPGKGNIKKILTLKNSNPNLDVVLSIGGYSLSRALFKAMEDSNRAGFVQSIITFLEQVNTDAGQTFDGVDIDWEPNDNGWTFATSVAGTSNTTDAYNQLQDYLDLMLEIRIALDNKYGKGKKTIGIAAPANANIIEAVEVI